MSNLKHSVNEKFWRDLGNEYVAYSLGFLCTDGGIVRRDSLKMWEHRGVNAK